MILHGKKDRWAPYALAEEMQKRIEGSRMITFEGGHLLVFFESRRFVDAAVEFLTRPA